MNDPHFRLRACTGETEWAVKQSGRAYTIARPVLFMQNLIGMLREGAIHTAAGDGTGCDGRRSRRRRGHGRRADLPGCDGKTYTLTGPQVVSFDEVAEILSRETGKRIRHVRVAPDDVRNALERSGVEAWFAEDMAKLHSMLSAGHQDLVTDDVRAVMGSSPCTLAEFGRDFAARFTGQHPGR